MKKLNIKKIIAKVLPSHNKRKDKQENTSYKQDEIVDKHEDLLGLLHRSKNNGQSVFTIGTGSPFGQDVIDNWYKARKYVLEYLETKEMLDRKANSAVPLHIVLEGTSGLMLSIARQIALIAHYPDFDEISGKNRTIITILYNKRIVKNIVEEVFKEEYLSNLKILGKYSTEDFEDSHSKKVKNEKSFIDIEFNLIGFNGEEFNRYQKPCQVRIKESDIQDIPLERGMDVSKAKRTNMVYNVGADFYHLPPDDPNTPERYHKALQYFCYQLSPSCTQEKWDMLAKQEAGEQINQVNLRNKISNILCSDCFVSRIKYLLQQKEKTTVHNEDVKKKIFLEEQAVQKLVNDNLQILAKCEHARWNVEKLILGFKPLTEVEFLNDERVFGKERIEYRNKLKKRGIHIDLCSYNRLKRVDPGNMKYDCFLMMAIPRILKEYYKHQEQISKKLKK